MRELISTTPFRYATRLDREPLPDARTDLYNAIQVIRDTVDCGTQASKSKAEQLIWALWQLKTAETLASMENRICSNAPPPPPAQLNQVKAQRELSRAFGFNVLALPEFRIPKHLPAVLFRLRSGF